MTLNCVDLSNYSGELSAQQVADLKAAGIVLGIVQAVDPPAGYPRGVTRQQIQALTAGGIVVDAYIWLWFDLDIADIERKLALLQGLQIRQLWLDVEDQAAARYDQATCEIKVRQALERCDEFPTTLGRPTGVYSGRWFWTDARYMNNTTVFSDRLLWDSQYDDIPDTDVFRPYGGWQSCAIKQYKGTSTFGSVSGVDLNVLSAAELAALDGGDVDCAELQQKVDGFAVTIADMADRIGDAILAETRRPKGMRKTYLRSLVDQLHDERVQAVGERPA